MATKTGYLKDSIAKVDGYYSPRGEKLKGATLSQADIDAWNGTKKKAKVAPKKKVEEVAEESSEEEDSTAEPKSLNDEDWRSAEQKSFLQKIFNK